MEREVDREVERRRGEKPEVSARVCRWRRRPHRSAEELVPVEEGAAQRAGRVQLEDAELLRLLAVPLRAAAARSIESALFLRRPTPPEPPNESSTPSEHTNTTGSVIQMKGCWNHSTIKADELELTRFIQ